MTESGEFVIGQTMAPTLVFLETIRLQVFAYLISGRGNLHQERAFGQDFPSNRNRLLNQLAASLSNCRPPFCLPILAASLSN